MDKIKAFAAEGAKGIKTEADLTAFMREILKTTLETALQAELSDHLGMTNTKPGHRPMRVMALRVRPSKASTVRWKSPPREIGKGVSSRNWLPSIRHI